MESDKKRRKIDDGEDFDGNDDPIYRDDEGNIIPTFKTKDEGTNNNLLGGALDLNNFWNSWGKETQPGQNPEAAPETTSEPGASEPGEEVLDVDDEDRKEADFTLNRFFFRMLREKLIKQCNLMLIKMNMKIELMTIIGLGLPEDKNEIERRALNKAKTVTLLTI